MKLRQYITLLIGTLYLQNCSTQNYLEETTLQKIVSERKFTFMAQKANPTNFDVINIANSIPNYGAGRMLNLDHGYTLVLNNNELTATLPYFGRFFSGNSNNEQGYKFISKNFFVQETNQKKGRKNIKIMPEDLQNISAIYIEIYKNGRATVSIDSNDRQPISYDGYIMQNESQ